MHHAPKVCPYRMPDLHACVHLRRCRFGTSVVPAVLETTSIISCTSPNTTVSGPVPLEVSLNAQDYSTGGGEFCFFNVSSLSFEPIAGPDYGGTRMLVRGEGLVPHGCHADAAAEPKQCKWYNPVLDRHVLAPGTVSASRTAIVCYSPPLPEHWTTSTPLELFVTLNSFDFHSVGFFTYEFVPIQPALSPASGPVAGGTRLTLYGASMRDVPELACYFGARTSTATWESNAVATCFSPDLASVASAAAPAPPDSTPVVESLFRQMTDISAAALGSSPTIDLYFDEVMARLRQRELDAYAFGATVGSLDSAGTVVPPAPDGLPVDSSPAGQVPPFLRMGSLTLSSDVVIAENAATLTPEPITAANSASAAAPRLLRPGGSLLHVLVPNGNAPLPAYDLYAELLFIRSAAAPEGAPPSAGGGVSIEYGPDEVSGIGSVRAGRRRYAALDGALPQHLRAASEEAIGLNVTLLGLEEGLSMSALHNGTETISQSVALSSSATLGPPLDVWLGLEMRVYSDRETSAFYANISLAGVQLSPPIELPGWLPQAGWTFRVRAVGDSLIHTRVSRLRVISGCMSQLSLVNLLVAVGPLFVSPTSAFAFYSPPLVPNGGIMPSAGPVLGGTHVRVTVTNYSHTIGALAAEHVDLKCRFGDSAAAVVSASHWADDNETRAGFACTSPQSAFGAGPISLQISANGQQYTHAGGFAYYDEPARVYATPRAGPLHGGALITFRGDSLFGGSDYACRVAGTVVPATHRIFPDRVQCRSPNSTAAGLASSPLALALNAQQFVSLGDANGSFLVYHPSAMIEAIPLSGPADGGSAVEVVAADGGFSGSARPSGGFSAGHGGDAVGDFEGGSGSGETGSGIGSGAFEGWVDDDDQRQSRSTHLRYRCVFGHAVRTPADAMLDEGVAGVVAATFLSDSRLRCVAPSAESAGAADVWQPLNDGSLMTVHGAAVVHNGSAVLTSADGECGSLLLPPRNGSSGRARATWFEHTVMLRARVPSPMWGARACSGEHRTACSHSHAATHMQPLTCSHSHAAVTLHAPK
jgi:hypothetical protein